MGDEELYEVETVGSLREKYRTAQRELKRVKEIVEAQVRGIG